MVKVGVNVENIVGVEDGVRVWVRVGFTVGDGRGTVGVGVTCWIRLVGVEVRPGVKVAAPEFVGVCSVSWLRASCAIVNPRQ